MLISSAIARANAAFLAISGFALLFASDALLPRIIATFPPGAAWFGQILGAALLALAVFNWFHRSALQGGIHGRPVVSANMTFHFVSALTLLKVVTRSDAGRAVWFAFVPMAIFAIAYTWLTFRGPFARDLEMQRKDA
jgi:hypothetical protein